jgi:hypothetical protein
VVIEQKIKRFYQHVDALMEDISGLEINCFETEYLKLQDELESLQRLISPVFATSKQLYLQTCIKEKPLTDGSFLSVIASSHFQSTQGQVKRIQREGNEKLEIIRKTYLFKRIGESDDLGKIDETLENIERILKKEPNNQAAHKFLDKLIIAGSNDVSNLSWNYLEKAKCLQNRFRCKYLGCFSHPEMKRPFSLVSQENGKIIYTSDPISCKIHRFSRDGQYIGPVEGNYKHPFGLIYESENCFWVCDSGNRRLVAIGEGGSIIKIFSLDFEFKNYPFSYPIFGFLSNNRFYLVNNNKEGDVRVLLTFRKDNHNDWHEIVPADMGQRFTGLTLWEDMIFFTEYFSSHMLMLPTEHGKIYPLEKEWGQSTMKQLVSVGKWVFVCAEHYLLKYDMTSKELLFSLSVKEKFTEKDEVIEDVSVGPHVDGKSFLYLSTYSADKNIGYIHTYEV